MSLQHTRSPLLRQTVPAQCHRSSVPPFHRCLLSEILLRQYTRRHDTRFVRPTEGLIGTQRSNLPPGLLPLCRARATGKCRVKKLREEKENSSSRKACVRKNHTVFCLKSLECPQNPIALGFCDAEHLKRAPPDWRRETVMHLPRSAPAPRTSSSTLAAAAGSERDSARAQLMVRAPRTIVLAAARPTGPRTPRHVEALLILYS